ncbi:hypothetical protein E1B28_005461 [Marasmius oreades]|uniref:RBR-type E3 ubiquitin transferase n=1 Tax=Marasmius oreades TaxID=181124 RepID=A0A9P7UU97_9AGAR|nr:uncharacterized protein E1B28_005461 [Marasmius oreades]KAG7094637.1 hypothetical protein E1B28_005461 [Marasmius oreades]
MPPQPRVRLPPQSPTLTPQRCPHFLKGRCWRSNKCRKVHSLPGSEPNCNPSSQHVDLAQVEDQDQTADGTIPLVSAVATTLSDGDGCEYRYNRETDTGLGANKSLASRGVGARIAKQEAEERNRRDPEEKRLREEAEEQLWEEEEKQRLEEEQQQLKEVAEKNRREAQEQERIRFEAVEKARCHTKAREKGRRDAERRREAVQRLQEAEERRRREEAETEGQRVEEERQRRIREAEEERLWQEAEQRAQKLREEEEARREERDRVDQAKTVQHLVFGNTIVKFSSGINIERIVTGFDSCRVRVTDLPFSTKPNDVCDLLRGQDIDEDSFQFVNMRVWKGKKEANFIIEGEQGQTLAEDLDGLHFRGQTLSAEASASGSLQGMNSNNSSTLSISWVLPSARYVVHFKTATEALKKHALDGWNYHGRKIKVEPNRLQGQVNVDPCSLLVSRLPMGTAVGDVRELFEATTLRKLRSNEYNDEPVEQWLKTFIQNYMRGGFVEFESVQVNKFEGKRSVRVRFESWEDAKRVHGQLVNVKFDVIGNSMFRLWLPDPYQITIPMEQYQAQKKQWDTFVKDTKESVLNVQVLKDKAILRVGGDDLKAVGMLKVRVESLVAGEILRDMWHVWFDTAAGKKFLQSVNTDTGAYIRHDWRLRVLKVYGTSVAVSKAKEMMKEELERLSGLEHTETLKRQSIRFFVERGVAALKEAFGDDSVTLNITSTPVCITIRGGEEARHLLRKLIDESLYNVTTDFSATSESSCPVCLAEVSNSFKLGCGHEYCTACLRHFLTTDIRDFPVVCVGDEATCGKPISLPTIQKFLTESQFNTLLETAFSKHIEQNHLTYRYCNTPDCQQIYRCEDPSMADSAPITNRQCPSCLAVICMRCHGDAHDGMTCDERREHFEPPEYIVLNEAWAKRAGAKRCPSCDVWMEKTEGCNHMSCKCGAHVCWECMKAFAQKDIYEHMTVVHGGIYEGREPGYGMVPVGDDDVSENEDGDGNGGGAEPLERNRYMSQIERLQAGWRLQQERQQAEELRVRREAEALKQAYKDRLARECERLVREARERELQEQARQRVEREAKVLRQAQYNARVRLEEVRLAQERERRERLVREACEAREREQEQARQRVERETEALRQTRLAEYNERVRLAQEQETRERERVAVLILKRERLEEVQRATLRRILAQQQQQQ